MPTRDFSPSKIMLRPTREPNERCVHNDQSGFPSQTESDPSLRASNLSAITRQSTSVRAPSTTHLTGVGVRREYIRAQREAESSRSCDGATDRSVPYKNDSGAVGKTFASRKLTCNECAVRDNRDSKVIEISYCVPCESLVSEH